MKVEISVIVPIYNASLYLDKCIRSILNQNNENFEVLLIDDGSTDSSGDICDKFARIDNRIKVIHKVNGGVSSARNVGLNMAIGDWVAFVDSDDIVSPDYLTIPTDMIDSDIIEKEYIVTGKNGCYRHKICKEETIIVSKDQDIPYKRYFRKCQFALWNRLYSRRVVANLKFDESLKIGEDLVFFLSMLSGVRKYSYTSLGYYNYFIREGSAMSFSKIDSQKRIKRLFHMIEILRELPVYGNMDYLISAILYKHNMLILFKLKNELSTEECEELSQLKKLVRFRKLRYLTFKDKLIFCYFYLFS